MSGFSNPQYKPIFNIRVYGILEWNQKILVSDEFHFGRAITKFPGGGLHFGEGTRECLAREFREELQIDVDVPDHFYTTDFFQPSAFDPSQQVVSIYYRVQSQQAPEIQTALNPFEFDHEAGITQKFRWLKATDLNPDSLTFPIDKRVADLLSGSIRA